jgi:hypothetical protein
LNRWHPPQGLRPGSRQIRWSGPSQTKVPQQRCRHQRERGGRRRGPRAQRVAIEDDREYGALAEWELGSDRGEGGGQANAPRLFLEHEQAREVPILEDIAKRLLWIDVKRSDLFRRDPGAHDPVEQPSQQREKNVAQAEGPARTRDRTKWRVGHRRFGARSAGLLPIFNATLRLV